MKPSLSVILLVFAAMNLSGCAGWHMVPKNPRPDPRIGNSQNYDAYVRRRTNELIGGGEKDAQKARSIADSEARRRFGERVDGGTTNIASWTWTNNNSRNLTLSELDQAVADLKKK